MDDDNFFLNELIDALPVALFCKDYSSGKGIFVHWNHQAEITWGLKKNEVLGKSDYDFFPVDQAEHFKRKDHETLKSGKLIHIPEEPVDSPSLGRRIVRTWKVPIQLAGVPRYMLGMSFDITEQINLQEELDRERQNAINTSKLVALGEMAGGIAHEVNNPLSVLTMSCELLKAQVENSELDPEDLKATVDRMLRTTDRISKVVRGLLNISRESIVEKDSTCSVQDILDDVMGSCVEKFRLHGIKIKVAGHEEFLKQEFPCSRVQISQVFLNLFGNAFDAVNELDDRWVQLEVTHQEDHLVISFTDSGCGIRKELHQKIFNPFFSSKEVGKGTGIGLSISKEIIHKHGGTLVLNSNHPNTQFIIHLPLEA
jgi:PAS domain S-box-containing protein